MKLSTETVEVLKNFATINSNIAIGGDTSIKTVAIAKNVMAKAPVNETFPYKFGVYDLGEFLSAYGMFDDPELDFDTNEKFVTMTSNNSSVKYFFSDVENLITSDKDVVMPSIELEFTLTNGQMNSLRRASAALKSHDITVVRDGDKLNVSVTDITNVTSNKFTLEVDNCSINTDEPFEFVFNINNFKFNSSDEFKFGVSSKMIASVEAAGIDYWLALEKSSKYGV
jgi:hypothetical protein